MGAKSTLEKRRWRQAQENNARAWILHKFRRLRDCICASLKDLGQHIRRVWVLKHTKVDDADFRSEKPGVHYPMETCVGDCLPCAISTTTQNTQSVQHATNLWEWLTVTHQREPHASGTPPQVTNVRVSFKYSSCRKKVVDVFAWCERALSLGMFGCGVVCNDVSWCTVIRCGLS